MLFAEPKVNHFVQCTLCLRWDYLELIDVGKKQRALETLFEVITSRRHRTWTKTHEPLMEKFLELCVELKKSQLAKDGLHQYKTISQTVRFSIILFELLSFVLVGISQIARRCHYEIPQTR